MTTSAHATPSDKLLGTLPSPTSMLEYPKDAIVRTLLEEVVATLRGHLTLEKDVAFYGDAGFKMYSGTVDYLIRSTSSFIVIRCGYGTQQYDDFNVLVQSACLVKVLGIQVPVYQVSTDGRGFRFSVLYPDGSVKKSKILHIHESDLKDREAMTNSLGDILDCFY